MKQLQLAQKRTVQYWYSDGINELGFGALLLLLGAYFFLEGGLEPSNPLRFILESGFVLIIVGGGLLINRLVRLGKERLTYQRTGFVDYPRRKTPAWAHTLLGVVIAIFMAGLVAMLAVSQVNADRWLPIISGLILGGVFFFFGLRTGLIRFFLISIITLVIGGGIVLTGIAGNLAFGAFYALSGLCVLLSGACTLINYLRSHPYQAGNSDES